MSQHDLFPLVNKPPLTKRQLRKAVRDQEKANRERILVEQASNCERLHKRWQELFDKPGQSLTKLRRQHTSRMLARYGYDKLDLVLQVAAADPNTRGHNKLNRPFDDLINIFRNEERVDMYLTMAKLSRPTDYVPGDSTRSERL